MKYTIDTILKYMTFLRIREVTLSNGRVLTKGYIEDMKDALGPEYELEVNNDLIPELKGGKVFGIDRKYVERNPVLGEPTL